MKRILILSVLCLLGACQTLKTSPELIARGNGYLTDGNVEQAIKYYDKAVALNPDNMDAYEARGAAYFFKGDYEKATADFSKAINANPNNSDLYTAYAAAAAALKDYDNALKALEMAQQINPSKPEIFFSRGNIYYVMGHYDLAVNEFSNLLEMYTANEVLNARAAALIKLGQTQAAKQDLLEARSGKYPDTLSEYAKAK